MPLYDIEGHHYEVDPKSVETSPYLQALASALSKKTLTALCGKFDRALDLEIQIARQAARLTWTKTGRLVGFKSPVATADTTYIWQTVQSVMGTTGRSQTFAMGLLVRWRISLRDETWLTNKRETDLVDPLTGETVFAAQYWINDNFVFRAAPKGTQKIIQKGLQEAYSDYRDSTPMAQAFAASLKRRKT